MKTITENVNIRDNEKFNLLLYLHTLHLKLSNRYHFAHTENKLCAENLTEIGRVNNYSDCNGVLLPLL